jgi:hypothetical protein
MLEPLAPLQPQCLSDRSSQLHSHVETRAQRHFADGPSLSCSSARPQDKRHQT